MNKKAKTNVYAIGLLTNCAGVYFVFLILRENNKEKKL